MAVSGSTNSRVADSKRIAIGAGERIIPDSSCAKEKSKRESVCVRVRSMKYRGFVCKTAAEWETERGRIGARKLLS